MLCSQINIPSSGGTSIFFFFFFFVGASRGQNVILRGQKSKNLPKIAYFGHFLLLTGGASGGRASDWGATAPPCPPLMPPLIPRGHCSEPFSYLKVFIPISFYSE